MERVVRIRSHGRRADRRTVVITGEQKFILDREEVAGLNLRDGAAVEEDVVKRLASLHEQRSARDAALRLLRFRLRSRAELKTRLRRRFTPDVVERVCSGLIAQGLVDDARFARAWTQSRLATGQAGPQRVRAELRQRGVSPALIEQTLGEFYGDTVEHTLADALVARHLPRLRRLPRDVRIRRLAGLLRRRGFSGAVIGPLLRRARRNDRTGAAEDEP